MDRAISSKSNNNLYLIIAIIVILLLSLISLFTGAYDILGQKDGWDMFFITRVPRTIALMLSGAAMAIAGLVMQLLTQNRFVEPTTSGTSEWAGLGLMVSFLLLPSPTLLQRMIFTIVFSFIGTMVFFLLLKRIRLKSSLMVPVIGIMLGAIVSAVSTFLGLLFSMTQSMEDWFQASFAPIQKGRYEFLWLIIIFTALIYLYADRITLAGLGKSVATNLGLNYNKIILIGTALVSITVGIVAAVVGNLPFIGLIVPNIVSLIRGDNLKSNLIWGSLFGMGIISLCDIIARLVIRPFELPVSLILGSFGALVFIFLLLIQRKAR